MLMASRPAAWSAGSLRARVRPLVVMAIVSRPGSAFSRATSSTASPRTSGSPPVSRIWADSREQTRTLTRWSHLLDALGHEDPRDLDDLVRGEEIWRGGERRPLQRHAVLAPEVAPADHRD